MKILSLSPYFYPHIGGVEKHVFRISRELAKEGHEITVLTRKTNNLPQKQNVDGINVVRFTYPSIKFIGLISIWKWIYLHRELIEKADIVHCHDVFIWYFPFRFFYPFKRVFTTFHGWEGVWPIPTKNIIYKKIAEKLSSGTIAIGKYIEKYYSIKADKIVYGGVEKVNIKQKNKNSIVWVGRLEKDTGIIKFLEWLDKNRKYKVEFVGDGRYRDLCSSYGVVHGFVDAKSYIQKSEICVPAGYLSYLEALESNCKIITFANSPLKSDYWNEIKKINSFSSWKQISYEYLNLYNNI